MRRTQWILPACLIPLALRPGPDHAAEPIDPSNPAGLKETVILRGHTAPVFSLAFSPDGARLATASIDKTGRIWYVKSGKETAVLKRHTAQVVIVGFSADGLSVVTGSYDKTVRTWDATTGQERPGAPPPQDAKAPMDVANIDNMVIAMNQDATAILYSTDFGGIHRWDVKTGKRYSRGAIAGPQGAAPLKVSGIAFGPGASLITSFENHLRTWKFKPLPDEGAFTPIMPLDGPEGADYSSIAVSRDGKVLAVVENGANGIQLWDAEGGMALSLLKGPTDMISGLSFSPDGRLLAVSSYDGTIRLFAVKGGNEVTSLKCSTKGKPASVRFSPDGSQIASGTLEGPAIIWALPGK